ncbi:hypothetical protein R3P38DRAFT_1194741 [Favolaschia claudopus]|uniref:Uncharacterized protein n=1 Tax=Favolaschia claudopus TaxID=2862362 RepID=A0AAW0E387_9AGAR
MSLTIRLRLRYRPTQLLCPRMSLSGGDGGPPSFVSALDAASLSRCVVEVLGRFRLVEASFALLQRRGGYCLAVSGMDGLRAYANCGAPMPIRRRSTPAAGFESLSARWVCVLSFATYTRQARVGGRGSGRGGEGIAVFFFVALQVSEIPMVCGDALAPVTQVRSGEVIDGPMVGRERSERDAYAPVTSMGRGELHLLCCGRIMCHRGVHCEADE